MHSGMKKYRLIAIITTWIVSCFCAFAQEVIVTVTPVQQVLPPQVLLEQINPASDLAIATPANRQPKSPFVIQGNSVYTLNSVEMKNMFNHIPASEIQCPANLFDDYQSGAFGLLPEGTYRTKITAYRWNNPQLATPVVVSNPEGGTCTFQICYKAQAPQFLTPIINVMSDETVAQLDPLSAQFSWTMPVVACGSSASYTYDIKMVELFPGQQPDVAMDRNPVVYQVKDLLANMCVIPTQVVTSNFYADRTYLAQVTALPKANGTLSYVMIENSGKSTYLPFKFKTDVGNKEPEPEKTEEKDEEENDDDDDDDDEE